MLAKLDLLEPWQKHKIYLAFADDTQFDSVVSMLFSANTFIRFVDGKYQQYPQADYRYMLSTLLLKKHICTDEIYLV